MLIVAPSGKTKLEVRLETPLLFSRPSIVNGSVAELDAVEKAFNKAVAIPEANDIGLRFPNMTNRSGRMKIAWIPRPISTVRLYFPTAINSGKKPSNPPSDPILPAINPNIPTGDINIIQ